MDGCNALGLVGGSAGHLSDTADRWFEDVAIGERFTLHPRRIDAHMVTAFTGAACLADGPGDAISPFHLLLHSLCTVFADGMQLASGGLISQCCRFTRPAISTDVLHPVLQVIALHPEPRDGIVVLRSTIHTQHGEMLMDGEQHYRVRRLACLRDV